MVTLLGVESLESRSREWKVKNDILNSSTSEPLDSVIRVLAGCAASMLCQTCVAASSPKRQRHRPPRYRDDQPGSTRGCPGQESPTNGDGAPRVRPLPKGRRSCFSHPPCSPLHTPKGRGLSTGEFWIDIAQKGVCLAHFGVRFEFVSPRKPVRFGFVFPNFC